MDTDSPPPNADAGLIPDGSADASRLVDIADELMAVDVSAVKELASQTPYRRFAFTVQQPVDHFETENDYFSQRIVLHFRDYDAPMVVVEAGYGFSEDLEPNIVETTKLVSGNQLVIEHRFFGESIPPNSSWTNLTVKQAAADTHNLTRMFKPLFTRQWIGTGYSKGGMATLFHHFYHPEDFHAITPYVAPVLLSYDDERFVQCIRDISLACKSDVETHQRWVLMNLNAVVDQLFANHGMSIDRTKMKHAVVDRVLRANWYRWQFEGSAVCDNPPSTSATVEEMAVLYDVQPYWLVNPHPSDPSVDAFNYQARREVGRSFMYMAHIADLLPEGYQQERVYDDVIARPWVNDPEFDPSAMHATLDWYRTSAENVLAFYGKFDPNTCGAITVDESRNSRIYVAEQGHHWSSVQDLDSSQRESYMDHLAGILSR